MDRPDDGRVMCTIAAVVAFLGYMPPRGTQIVVPRSQIDQYTPSQQFKARLCARRFGLQWRIDEDR